MTKILEVGISYNEKNYQVTAWCLDVSHCDHTATFSAVLLF